MIDTYVLVLQIRTWLDTDAATYTSMPILVANEGQARLELFKDRVLIDTVHIYNYDRQELNELLEEMGQERDLDRSWERLAKEKEFDDLVSNWGAYNQIATESDQKARLEAEYDQEQLEKKQKEENKQEDL